MLEKIFAPIWGWISVRSRRRITRLFHPTFTASAAVIIFDNSGKVLLLKHTIRPGSGWGIPGGFLKAGEQPEEAIKRELLEEIGVELMEVLYLRTRIVARHIEFLFTGKISDRPEIKSNEISSIGWFRINELPEGMPPAQTVIIQKVYEDLFQDKAGVA
ncbi:MAG TPA: NUDIX domain-containing protein [Pyrinomonadaceae bacterium]|nr:NUDIX domain-containing protein [Pyrinomonadaceae bacterium]